MITPETQQMRDAIREPFKFCSPDHNLFYLSTNQCPKCGALLQARALRDAQYVSEIYRIERAAEIS